MDPPRSGGFRNQLINLSTTIYLIADSSIYSFLAQPLSAVECNEIGSMSVPISVNIVLWSK